MSNKYSGVQLLLTGNEIMSGDTIDSNSAMIAQRLSELAISVHRKVTVGDDKDLLTQELLAMTQSADLVIVNGGLGPTVDDLTAEILAEVAGVAVTEHPDALAHLQRWCAQRNLPLNDANYKQAILPEGCSLIDNPIGSAVGFELTINGCRVMCTPGVPSELRAMLDWIIEDIGAALERPSQRNILRLQTFGLGESSAQQLIADHIDDWPDTVELGFRAGAPQMEIKLTIDNASAAAQQHECRRQLEALFGDHIVGEGDSQLADVVLELLAQHNQTLATAESCTGGLIASMLTRVPGSSAGFHAGFVTYSNDMKTSLLGVDDDLLAAHGAVSEPVVIAMAEGAMTRANADYAIAVSGIAGPDGGTTDKPVGTVWLAWGSHGSIRTRCLCWPVERTLFQTMIAAAGLDMIRRTLLGIDDEPRYFSQRSAKASAD
ncbi:MAG: CinA family nicotinamide mononucleotide deamidase-related protein [Halioglobus sp.]